MRRPLISILLAILATGLLVVPASAVIFGVKTHDPFTEPPSTLFRFEDDGSGFATIGEIRLDGGPVVIDGLAVDQEGELFGFAIALGSSSQLVTIDSATAVAIAVGFPLHGRQLFGATFTPDNILLAVDTENDVLIQVDPFSGLEVGPPVPLTLDSEPFSMGEATDLASRSDARFFICHGDFEFYEIDVYTGVLTLIFDDEMVAGDGFRPFGAGLAFPEAALAGTRIFVFDVNGDDDVFSYVPDDAGSRALVFANIIGNYNAGRGDLAQFPAEIIAVEDALLPAPMILQPNRPNPFNPATTVVYELAAATHARIEIFAPDGRRVRTLVDGPHPSGRHDVRWDGRDDNGLTLPSGSYLCRIEAHGRTESRRMMLIR